jgi:DNA-binding transcriptional MocR family regulator
MRKRKEDSPLYLQVAHNLENQIQQGVFRTGDQVPSVRELSRQRRVSVATVLQAYFWLENKGWIEARPKSGFYVRTPDASLNPVPAFRPAAARPTPVTTSDILADLMHAHRGPVKVSLGTAVPAADLLPVHQLNAIIRRLSREDPNLSISHEHAPGDPALRRQIARRSVMAGCNFLPQNVTITCGATEALNLCLRAIGKPGDVIATESPTYFNVLQAIESLGMKAIEIPTDCQRGMDLNVLESVMKTHRVRGYIGITNCHNPLGYVLSDDKKRELVELLTHHEVPLIEDDICGDLAYSARRPRLAKSFDRAGLVLTCGSFSKTVSPGLRLGWVYSEEYQSRISRLKMITSIASPRISEAAVAEFLASGGYDRHVRRVRVLFEQQVSTFSQAVSKYFPEGTCVSRPAGGYVLWIELPKRVDSMALYHSALKEGISISPGPVFSAIGKFRNYIRLNCGISFSDEVDRAILKLGRMCEAQLR